jgi:hypothetical protein
MFRNTYENGEYSYELKGSTKDGYTEITLKTKLPIKEGNKLRAHLVETTLPYFNTLVPKINVAENKQEWEKEITQHFKNEYLDLVSFDEDDKDFKNNRCIVRETIRYGGAFMVNSENENGFYIIVFPEDNMVPPSIKINDDVIDLPYLPYCSCLSYYYQGYDKKNINGTKGGCKHLKKAFEFADDNKNFSDYDWNSRPEDRSLDPWAIKNNM